MELLTYTQAANLLGLKLSTLYAMVSRRQVPHVRLGGRLVRFDRAELETWLGERRVSVKVQSERR
jgi:excisionase family DNA binding protein